MTGEIIFSLPEKTLTGFDNPSTMKLIFHFALTMHGGKKSGERKREEEERVGGREEEAKKE